MVNHTELLKDVVAKRNQPDDPWDESASVEEHVERYWRLRGRQWIQQAHERGQNDLHIQQD